MSASCPIRSAARTRPGKSSSGLVFLVLGNWEAGVLYVGFDRCGVQVDEGFGETFADKQLGSSDMIRRQRCVGGSLREAHLIGRQVGDVGAISITTADSTYVPDVVT